MKAEEFLREYKIPKNVSGNPEYFHEDVINLMELYAEQKAVGFMNQCNPLKGVTYLTFNPETREPIWLSHTNTTIPLRLTTKQLYKEFNK